MEAVYFERHLTQSGYSYTNKGAVGDTIVLTVTTSNLEALGEVVKAANTEAALTGAPKNG